MKRPKFQVNDPVSLVGTGVVSGIHKRVACRYMKEDEVYFVYDVETSSGVKTVDESHLESLDYASEVYNSVAGDGSSSGKREQ